HPAQILHRACLRIETDELGIGIRAGVELAVPARVELPQVILGGRRFADDLQAFVRLLRIEAQDERAVPSAQINLAVRPGQQRPGPWTLGRVELTGLAGIRIDLHQEQPPAELIEVEIKRLAALAVGTDDAAHQTAFADGNAERLEAPALGL